MPARLRPSAPLAPDAILVGDPGRALALAQLLMKQPRMSNHARGLWGYTGETPDGRALTVQATGMGGPSAAIVLDDLSGLGVRRAIRVGTCVGAPGGARSGEILVVEEARGADGITLGLIPDGVARPDPALRSALEGAGRPASTVSTDRPAAAADPEAAGADLQTAAVLAVAAELGIAAAALLVVERIEGEAAPADEELAPPIETAGKAASGAFSTSG